MKKFSFILYFIFTFLFQKTFSKQDDLVDQQNDFFDHLTFAIIYSICWLLLIDVSLIIVFHYKHLNSHVANHSFINMCIVITQVVNFIFFWKTQKFSFSNTFIVIEIVAFIMELIQTLMGSLLIQKLQKKKFESGIFVNFLIHSNFGKIIYILRKFQIGYYLYFLIQKRSSTNPVIILVVIYTFIVLVHLLAFLFIKGKPFKLDKHPIKYLTETSNDSNKYQQLLQQIQNNELQDSMSEEELSVQILQTENRSLNSSLLDQNEQNEIRWVIIEDHVFDISEMKHPKGQYIINKIDGKDITREIYGLKSIRFENREKKISQTKKYSHSWKTLQYLTNYCIGPIDLPKLIIRDEEIIGEVTSMSMDFGVLDHQLSIFQKDNLARFQNFQQVQDLKLGQKNQLLFIEKKDHSVFFQLNSYWIDLFGKYFMVQQDTTMQYFYFALSLAPTYVHAKQKWMESLQNEVTEILLRDQGSMEQQLLGLYGKSNGSLEDKDRQLLEKDSTKLLSFEIPIIKTFRQKELKKTEDLYFKGPLGQGLGFDDQTTHKYLLLLEDDGVLPFLDLFEFFSQRALLQFSNKNDNSHPVFKMEDFYSYQNEVEFYVYWEINDKFINASQILGVKQLQTIYLTYEKETQNKPQKIMQNALLSCKVDVDYIPSVKAQLLNLEEIKNNILPENKLDQVSRYIISGSDQFVDKILKDTKEKRSRFKIL